MCRPFWEKLKHEPKWKDLKFVFAGNKITRLAVWLDEACFDEFIWIDKGRFIKSTSIGYRFSILKKIRLAGFEIVIQPSHTRQYWPESVVRVSGARQKITGESAGRYLNSWELNLTTCRYSEVIKTGPDGIFEFNRNRTFFSYLTGNANEVESLFFHIPEIQGFRNPWMDHILF